MSPSLIHATHAQVAAREARARLQAEADERRYLNAQPVKPAPKTPPAPAAPADGNRRGGRPTVRVINAPAKTPPASVPARRGGRPAPKPTAPGTVVLSAKEWGAVSRLIEVATAAKNRRTR